MKRYSNYDKCILNSNITGITFEGRSLSFELGTRSVNLLFMEGTHIIIMLSQHHQVKTYILSVLNKLSCFSLTQTYVASLSSTSKFYFLYFRLSPVNDGFYWQFFYCHCSLCVL